VRVESLTGRPALAATAGALAIAFSAILFRLAHVSPSTGAFFRCLWALPALGLLARSEDRRLGPRPRRTHVVAVGAGLFFAADLVLWHHAIEAVGAGLATVLGNVQVVLVGLAAWILLRERPSGRALAAIPIALAGVVLISGVVGGDAYGSNPRLGVVYGVLTGVAYTGFLLTLRHGSSDLRRPAGPLFDATLTSAAATAAAGVVVGDLDLTPSWSAQGWLVLLALSSQVLGWLLIAVSLPRLPAVLTSILLTLQPVASVVFAFLLLGESPSLAQLGGAAAILAGLLVATSGRRSAAAAVPVSEAASVASARRTGAATTD
jgi:drug/metabolite transporter (DMT)-like permease